MTIAPVIRNVHTKAPPERAFEVFTGRMGAWWPKGATLGKYHVDFVIEPEVGGRWYERDAEGQELQWGNVLVWSPPGRLVLAWRLDAQNHFDPNFVTEVEVTFAPAVGGGTDVTLEHRNLERFGDSAAKQAASVGGGWAKMLQAFADFTDL